MTVDRPAPVFVDTSVLYARFDERDGNHEPAVSLFNSIQHGDTVSRPLYVTSHVLGELSTLVLHNLGPAPTREVLGRILESSLFMVVHPDGRSLEDAYAQLERLDDQFITLVDHLTGVLANERDIETIASFDEDFRTLGFDLVPDDIDLSEADQFA